MTLWIESTPGNADPGPTDIHVWRFRLRAVAADAALRELLAAYVGAEPQEMAFTAGPQGKPALASPSSEFRFNVSHSGDWGLVAIARVEVGVDVEHVRPQRASTRLADRFLTAGERQLLQSRTASHDAAAFFTVWARKEAYLKAVGVGLSLPFSEIDSSGEFLPDLDAQGRRQPGSEPWIVREFIVDDLHPAAVVARAGQISLSCLTLGRSEA